MLLETRVARRMLGLFLLCALLPTALLALIGYRQVSGQLYEQGRLRLRKTSKETGMAIIQRLQLVESQLHSIGQSPVQTGISSQLEQNTWMESLVLVRPGAGNRQLWGGTSGAVPRLDSAQETHLSSGRALVVATIAASGPSVYMGLRVNQDRPQDGMLWVRLDVVQLLQQLQEDQSGETLCVIASPPGGAISCGGLDPRRIATQIDGQPSGDLTLEANGNEMVVGYWSAFLGFQWGAPAWTIAVGQPRSVLQAPAKDFGRTFVMVTLVSLVLVFLASNIQIRRGMEPLVRLQEGTLRVAAGDFGQPVAVNSGDEFEHLAESFNTMAGRLGRQFAALTAINDISRAALSELKPDRMIEMVLSRFNDTLPARAIALLTRGPEAWDKWHATVHCEKQRRSEIVNLDDVQWRFASRNQEYFWLSGQEFDDMAPQLFSGEVKDVSILLLPLTTPSRTIGCIAIALGADVTVSREDVAQSRQLADQVAIALANSRLVERLELMSWGTLSALARTIDANSSWTAGHSGRVTSLSLAIGRQLGVSAQDLETIHRGGLLHDIGKIGIPSAILDKPGKLTEEEMAIIQSHPAVGARILAPIPVLRDILSIVRNHHEKFDGTGYPDRLAGEAIPYLARIVAVADVFDALVSDRPYRAGWSEVDAVALICKTAGKHHDPAIVEAFLALVKAGGLSGLQLPEMPASLEEDNVFALGVTHE
ncbi:MAG: HD domain-containing phosphohydrolase [Gemmatimonadota bacterium]